MTSWHSRQVTRFPERSTMLPTSTSSRRIPFSWRRKMRCRFKISCSVLFSTPSGNCRSATRRISPRISKTSPGWLTRTFRHIEVAPIFTAGSGQPVNPLTGLDSNQTHAFPLSARPLGLGRNSLQNPGTVNMDFRVLKYFPFGESRHLDVVAEFFNLFNHPNVSADQSGVWIRPDADRRIWRTHRRNGRAPSSVFIGF